MAEYDYRNTASQESMNTLMDALSKLQQSNQFQQQQGLAQQKLKQDREMPDIEATAKAKGKGLEDQGDLQNLMKMFGGNTPQQAVQKAEIGGRGVQAAGINNTPDNSYRVAATNQKQIDAEQKAIASAAKGLGIPDFTKRTGAINSALNNLTLHNTMGDMAAQLQETIATLGPGGSRALGIVLKQKGLVPDTTEGSLNQWLNKAKSQADAIIPQDVASSMVDYLKAQKDQVAKDYGSAKNRLGAALPTMTRAHQAMGVDPSPYVSMFTGPLEDSFKQTDDLVGKLKAPPQTTQPFQQPQARTGMDNYMSKLKSFFMPNQTAQAQPQGQPGQGQPGQGQPQAPSQGMSQPSSDPIADEMKRRGLGQ